MRPRGWVGTASIALMVAGCTEQDALPWTLIELGTDPMVSAWDSGMLIMAEEEGGSAPWPAMLPPDTAQEGRIIRRDLSTLPVIACGDVMRLSPADLPLGLTDRLNWTGKDSLTVRWHCLDRTALATFGRAHVDAAEHPALVEAQWLQALKALEPEHFTRPTTRYAAGDSVLLQVVTLRPDRSRIGDTLHMDFTFGDRRQVVPALEATLSQAGPGADWSVWAGSAFAFGSGPHPELGLAAFTPLQFLVSAE